MQPRVRLVLFRCGVWAGYQWPPMARSSRALLLLLLVLLVCFSAVSSMSHKNHKHRHSGFSQSECPGACSFRCSKTAHHKACMFFCQKCCFTCRCVPPGTYGHKEVCPCYNNWKTKSGGPKCP